MSKYSVNLDDVRAAKPRVNRVTSFFSVLSLLVLGVLLGRETHRYEVQHVDDTRIRQLIEALEKKPTLIQMHPVLPIPVPVPVRPRESAPQLRDNNLTAARGVL
jgi:hypothetical protein